MTFKINQEDKLTVLLKVVSFCWIITKFLSYNVWISNRNFPIIPFFDDLLNVPNSIHLSLFFTASVLLFFILIAPLKKITIIFFLSIEFFSCILDQMRCQAWEFFFFMCYLFYVISNDKRQFLQRISWMLVALYFFSGINKFNGGFLGAFWDQMVLRKIFSFSNDFISSNLWIHYAGILLSIIEMILGLGLLFLKNKKVVVLMILLMHILIIMILGLNDFYNIIVFPWNMALMIIVYIVFYNNSENVLINSLTIKKMNLVILVVLFVLPFMNMFGYWYHYFSFNLYSGNQNKITVCINNTKDYAFLKKYTAISDSCKSKRQININKWTFDELNVPINPDEITFRKLKKAWDTKYPNIDVTFFSSHYPYKSHVLIME